MKKGLYVVYDLVASCCAGPVVQFAGDPAAGRFFVDLLGDRDTNVGKHPKDFELRRVGWIDDESSMIEPTYHVVVSGEQWVNMQEVK